MNRNNVQTIISNVRNFYLQEIQQAIDRVGGAGQLSILMGMSRTFISQVLHRANEDQTAASIPPLKRVADQIYDLKI
jgi:hypothetical protein